MATGLQETRLSKKITAVLVVLCFWSLHFVVVTQAIPVDTSLPVGLELTYRHSTYSSSTTTTYRILRWIDDLPVVEIARNNEIFHVNVTDWSIVNETGPERIFTQYPLWQNTSDWSLGRRLAIPDGGRQYRLQEYDYVRTGLGNTSCWRCLYRGTFAVYTYTGNYTYPYYINVYYDCSLGLLTFVSEESWGRNTSILTDVRGLSTGEETVTTVLNPILSPVLVVVIAIEALGLVLIVLKRRNSALQ